MNAKYSTLKKMKNIAQEYSSISEFREMNFFPETNPLILILEKNGEFLIEYANKPFIEAFSLIEKQKFEIPNSDPNLNDILTNLINKKYASFHLDFYFFNQKQNMVIPYFVEINRILIQNNEFSVITFSSLAERKQIEKRINNLHNALEFGKIPVITLDIEGRITYSTSSFEQILGKDISQIYKQSLVDILGNICSEENKKLIVNAINYQEEFREIIEITFENKKTFLELFLRPLYQSEKAELSFVVTATNVTALIEREAVINQSNKRKEEIINNIFEPIIILKEENGTLFYDGANENFYKEFLVSPEEIIGKHFDEVTNDHFWDTVLTSLDFIKSEKTNKFKFRYTHQPTLKEYLCKLSVFENEFDHTTIMIISFFDITQQIENERKLHEAYEKEKRLNKMKSSFLANMSHEIRTPLNAIVGYSDLLEDEIKNLSKPEMSEFVSYLKEGVERLLRLVDNIVDVSQIDSGEMQTEIHLYNVNKILEYVVDELKQTAEQNSIRIDLHLDEENKFIETDEIHLKKILFALIENAIKYNIEKGKVVIKTYPVNKDFRIEIIDTGVGISPEMLEEVLRPFSQQEIDGYRRRHEGAGLGLTLASKLTKMLGGELEIHSKIQNGTTIVLTFPEKQSNKN